MNEKDKKEKAEEMDEVLNENTETAEAENQEEAPQEEAAEEETEKCRSAIRSFNVISVREKSGVELLKNYLFAESEFVLDPTLLLKKEP